MSQRWFRHQHVIFDCDSTLSRIEGIDELANIAGVAQQVKHMTDAAMAGEIDLEEVYGKRLKLIRPTQKDIYQLKQAYRKTAVEDAQLVIQYLKECEHDIYIVSGGLIEPVREFGISLGISEENIKAVGVNYNQLSGQWWLSDTQANPGWSPDYLDFHQSPLTLSKGKQVIIDHLLNNKQGRSILIGDGMSDLLASSRVDQFVGYGGVIRRENVEKKSGVYVDCESLLPILALSGGQPLINNLKQNNNPLQEKLFLKLNESAHFKDPQLKDTLLKYFT